MQSTNHILMIRPVNFGFNEQTAVTNAFQNRQANQEQMQQKALKEFDDMVAVLRSNGVDVMVLDDTVEPHTPDSIFPNNWVSFHESGRIFLYPMQAENRRLERRPEILHQLKDTFSMNELVDLSNFELEQKYLEGTGSMVLDRDHKIAYACLSPRTDKEVLDAFCKREDFTPVLFHAFDEVNKAIYHTNVLMCVGSGYVVICLDSVKDQHERNMLVKTINQTGKEIISITYTQMNHFAGNMLEVKNRDGQRLLVMSTSAYHSLIDEQKVILEKYCKLIYSDISTIEANGGGSARCMMAEIHLPTR